MTIETNIIFNLLIAIVIYKVFINFIVMTIIRIAFKDPKENVIKKTFKERLQEKVDESTN